MDTCNKISKYMQEAGYECRAMGVPKTIDNDLWGTDHCPGYGSAAKYIATSIMEIYHDAEFMIGYGYSSRDNGRNKAGLPLQLLLLLIKVGLI